MSRRSLAAQSQSQAAAAATNCSDCAITFDEKRIPKACSKCKSPFCVSCFNKHHSCPAGAPSAHFDFLDPPGVSLRGAKSLQAKAKKIDSSAEVTPSVTVESFESESDSAGAKTFESSSRAGFPPEPDSEAAGGGTMPRLGSASEVEVALGPESPPTSSAAPTRTPASSQASVIIGGHWQPEDLGRLGEIQYVDSSSSSSSPTKPDHSSDDPGLTTVNYTEIDTSGLKGLLPKEIREVFRVAHLPQSNETFLTGTHVSDSMYVFICALEMDQENHDHRGCHGHGHGHHHDCASAASNLKVYNHLYAKLEDLESFLKLSRRDQQSSHLETISSVAIERPSGEQFLVDGLVNEIDTEVVISSIFGAVKRFILSHFNADVAPSDKNLDELEENFVNGTSGSESEQSDDEIETRKTATRKQDRKRGAASSTPSADSGQKTPSSTGTSSGTKVVRANRGKKGGESLADMQAREQKNREERLKLKRLETAAAQAAAAQAAAAEAELKAERQAAIEAAKVSAILREQKAAKKDVAARERDIELLKKQIADLKSNNKRQDSDASNNTPLPPPLPPKQTSTNAGSGGNGPFNAAQVEAIHTFNSALAMYSSMTTSLSIFHQQLGKDQHSTAMLTNANDRAHRSYTQYTEDKLEEMHSDHVANELRKKAKLASEGFAGYNNDGF